ncbi:hypothetical protein SPHINGOT1_340039 [Sphingomonas sp. T1]|nr:hypothetical protein SPHINGOT1_340039 [Sphingomonas sp. T1]
MVCDRFAAMIRDCRRDRPGIGFVDRCDFNALECGDKNGTASVPGDLLHCLCLFVQLSKFRS